jgi:O-antigen ligase
LGHAIYNISLFVSSGGAVRSFGVAGVPFADLAIPSVLYCCASIFWAKNGKTQIKYGSIFFVLLTSLLITQTRGALLSFVLSYLFVSFSVARRNKFLKFPRIGKRVIKLTCCLIVLLAVLIAFHPSFVTAFSHRFETLTQGPAETIQLRLVLWNLSLKAFLHSPVSGIGLGQFTRVAQIVPETRFIPLFQYISGLGSHNIALSYLAETGIMGFLCLLYFIFSFLKLAWSKFKVSKTKDELVISSTLLGTLFFVAVSSFYAGEWFWSVQGMEFMIFLALTTVNSR